MRGPDYARALERIARARHCPVVVGRNDVTCRLRGCLRPCIGHRYLVNGRVRRLEPSADATFLAKRLTKRFDCVRAL